MNIVCYSPSPDRPLQTLLRKTAKAIPLCGIEMHGSLSSLTSRLRQPGGNIGVLLLHVTGQETLADLLEVEDLLSDLPIVVLMGRQEPEVMRLAHKLKPRVILGNGSKSEEVCAVMQRLVPRICHRQGTESAFRDSFPAA